MDQIVGLRSRRGVVFLFLLRPRFCKLLQITRKTLLAIIQKNWLQQIPGLRIQQDSAAHRATLLAVRKTGSLSDARRRSTFCQFGYRTANEHCLRNTLFIGDGIEQKKLSQRRNQSLRNENITLVNNHLPQLRRFVVSFHRLRRRVGSLCGIGSVCQNNILGNYFRGFPFSFLGLDLFLDHKWGGSHLLDNVIKRLVGIFRRGVFT
mmetsp:Transcript_108257/g.312868  ORF Transcript_108257/g.312868 Transcript_108257/m.312868 type:complete len:206 (+) Transcript_108257:883-1500(+)